MQIERMHGTADGAVDWDDVFPTRKMRKRLRAAKHQASFGEKNTSENYSADSLQGLRAWEANLAEPLTIQEDRANEYDQQAGAAASLFG